MSSLKSLSSALILLLLDHAYLTAAPVDSDVSARQDDRLIVHAGVSGLFDAETIPTVAAEYRSGSSWIGLQPWLGAGWATDGAIFAGAGVLHTWHLPQSWELVAGFGPGYYDRHEGVDLGSHLEFYSFAEAGREIAPGRRLLLRFAHISNGSLADRNPGTELLTLGISLRLP